MPGYADRRSDLTHTVDDGSGNTIYADLVFTYIEGVSLVQKPSQLGFESIDIGNRVRGLLWQPT